MSKCLPTDLPDMVQCMTCNVIAMKEYFKDHKCDPYQAATFVEKEILSRLDRIEKTLVGFTGSFL